MMNGFEENDIMSLFEQMSQGQQPEEQVGGEPMPADQLDQTSQQLTEDESMHFDDMSEEEAAALIMAARAPWFEEENQDS